MKDFSNLIKFLTGMLIMILFNYADCSGLKKEPTCYSSEEFKSYVIFGKGSYWIYENDSGAVDTVTIEKIEKKLQDGVYTYPFERFDITKVSTLHGTEKFVAQCMDVNSVGCDDYSILTSNYFSPSYFFCCCEPGWYDNYLTYLGEDSATINNIYYPLLKTFESDSIDSESLRLLFYVKDIGLVKYEDYAGNTWELSDYNITGYK